MIKFTQITNKLKYPPNIRGTLSTAHAAVVTYVVNHFHNVQSYRNKIISVINSLSYYIQVNDGLPTEWNSKDPLSLPIVSDQTELRRGAGILYVHSKDITWDVEETESISDSPSSNVNIETAVSTAVISPSVPNILPTDKSDLYLRSPIVPAFDTNNIWCSRKLGDDVYCIYASLPEIPTKQTEISVTTDVNKMTDKDLLRLYPTSFVPTRSAELYVPQPSMEFHPQLGCILPIQGYTKEQLLDNVIRYPHFYRLQKVIDNNCDNFYTTIEIDGELHRTLDVWDSLPESAFIPKSAEFIREYVIRKYLLERDYLGIHHRYMMYGTLDPFITLIAPAETYKSWGYTDVLSIAKNCVNARVSYKRSRNPVLRRLGVN